MTGVNVNGIRNDGVKCSKFRVNNVNNETWLSDLETKSAKEFTHTL